MLSPKERFSDRVADYVRYRPDYPSAAIEFLAHTARLGPESVVADIGSGTGISARRLLGTGAHVIAVEPNAEMRRAAEVALSSNPQFESRNASAEATCLADASADLIVAAQAFHWFDPATARVEFVRISKAGALVALIWNQRKDTPENRDYEAMLERFAPDYAHVRERDRAAESKIRAFFAPASVTLSTFENEQTFDAEGLRGRLRSSSYAPRPGDPLHAEIMAGLDSLFQKHAQEGRFAIAYETVVWVGCLRPRV